MSVIRRWARKIYYEISPIYQDELFRKPGNQALVSIHPRLFAAYCFKMNKQHFYTQQKISELASSYFAKENYWINYLLKVVTGIGTTEICPQSYVQNRESVRAKFQFLISKLFNKQINQKEFRQLCECFQIMLTNEQVTDLDLLILDASFYTIDQIAQITSLKLTTALEAIGQYSLKLIENQVSRSFNQNIFHFILIFNKIKIKENLSPQLRSLCQLLSQDKTTVTGKRTQISDYVRKQIFGYMIWLININELGGFISQYVFQHDLFHQYCKNSIQIVCQIIEKYDFLSSATISEVLILNQIANKLQILMQRVSIFEDLKTNVHFELKLKKMREKIHLFISQSEGKLEDHAWIEQISVYELDFGAGQSISLIKKLISKLLQHPHFTIILPQLYYSKILRLCIKIDELDLFQKVYKKVGKSKLIDYEGKNGLLQSLERIYTNRFNDQQGRIQIPNIFELKRIKIIAWKRRNDIDKVCQYFHKGDKELVKAFLTQLNNEQTLIKESSNHSFQRLFKGYQP